MNLKDYLYKKRIMPIEFAVTTGLSIASVYKYMRGGRPYLKIAILIEKCTKGEVTVQELRGDYERKKPKKPE